MVLISDEHGVRGRTQEEAVTYNRSFVLTTHLLFTLAEASLTGRCCTSFTTPALTISDTQFIIIVG